MCLCSWFRPACRQPFGRPRHFTVTSVCCSVTRPSSNRNNCRAQIGASEGRAQHHLRAHLCYFVCWFCRPRTNFHAAIVSSRCRNPAPSRAEGQDTFGGDRVKHRNTTSCGLCGRLPLHLGLDHRKSPKISLRYRCPFEEVSRKKLTRPRPAPSSAANAHLWYTGTTQVISLSRT